MPSKTIGNIVRSARTLMQLSRDDLAKRLDISAQYLGHVERDEPVRVSCKLARALEKELKMSSMQITQLIDQHNVHVLRTNRMRRKNSA